MNEIKANLRKLRLIQLGLIAALIIFACVAEIGRGHGNGDWISRHWLVAGLALWAASAGFRFRHRLLHRSGDALAKVASNPKALKQWEAGHVFSLVLAEGVALWGLVVRMVLGGHFGRPRCFTRLACFCCCSGRLGCQIQLPRTNRRDCVWHPSTCRTVSPAPIIPHPPRWRCPPD